MKALYFLSVLILVVIIIALVVALKRAREGAVPNKDQARVKEEHLARSLTLAREQGSVTNNDIERLLGVSDATAERYLSELEARGKVVQIGTVGKAVRYGVK